MGTQSDGIEIGWGERSVEGGSAVVQAAQADERRAVLHEEIRASMNFWMVSAEDDANREGDIYEPTVSLSVLSSSKLVMGDQ